MSKVKAVSFREQLKNIARDFARSHAKEYELDDLVKWAIDTERWTMSAQDRFRIARKQFADALRLSKDDEGFRVFVDAEIKQTRLWADRRDASWTLRQRFIDEQAARSVAFENAVRAMFDKLNSERRKGERQFTLTFPSTP
jgi:hypothetical protein